MFGESEASKSFPGGRIRVPLGNDENSCAGVGGQDTACRFDSELHLIGLRTKKPSRVSEYRLAPNYISIS